ncbi:MAG: [FeFe] hydrogenase H-cluster radical SAM maturase HydG [Bacilli bacterium]
MFIDNQYIKEILKVNPTYEDVLSVIHRSREGESLSHKDIAVLLNAEDEKSIALVFDEASRIKSKYYGNRVVLFAPLYVSDYCTNNCTYCGYKRSNDFTRRKLSYDEIKEEVKFLEELGHKRLALEVGEDEVNFDFETILSSIDAIYENSSIRRINVNIAPVSVEKFSRLKAKNIGTYILFQETYDKKMYEKYHSKSLKGDFDRQLYAHHNAMKGGIDDVGGGVLFGLSDYKFEVLCLMLHNEELEKEFNVGFHTVSVPRIRKAIGMEINEFNHLVSDEEFKKLVAIIRIAIPFTGIILSTRESEVMRQELIDLGITQISAGSQTGVGGYKDSQSGKASLQFATNDERSPIEVIKDLIRRGYLPSYCTACYRVGRVGQDFMDIVKANKIHLLCHPNSLITFTEYIEDYGDEELKTLGYKLIENELAKIENIEFRKKVSEKVDLIRKGERDLYV